MSVGGSAEEILRRFNVSRESRARLELYVELLGRWQSRINLVSTDSLRSVWDRHVADALQLKTHIGEGRQTLIDLGSGAGLPGLVLALAYPDIEAVLIETNDKKAAFLREVARAARISIKVIVDRIERVDSEPYRLRGAVITARALAPLPELLKLAEPFFCGNRSLFHKGQSVDRELIDAAKSWSILYIKHMSVVDPRGTILEILEARRSHEHRTSRLGR